MLGLMLKVAGGAIAVGFTAGIIATRKAEVAKENVKQKFSKMKTEVVEISLPKSVKLEDCRVQVLVPLNDDQAGE